MALYYEKVPSDAEHEAQPLKALAFSKSASLRLHLQDDAHSLLGGGHAWYRTQVVVACVAYALVGPSLVMINNHILKQLSFPYPLILSCTGLVTTALVCTIILRVSGLIAARREATASSQPLTPIEANQREPRREHPQQEGIKSGLPQVSFEFWLRNMVPIGAAQGLTFFGTNAAYMYLTITFTQMLAAFTPTVTLVLLYLTGNPHAEHPASHELCIGAYIGACMDKCAHDCVRERALSVRNTLQG